MKQRFSNIKYFVKNLFKVNKKNFGHLENKIMSKLPKLFAVKLLANSAVGRNCFIVLNMPSVFTFHISLEILYYSYN